MAISSGTDSEEEELTGGGSSRAKAQRKQQIAAKSRELAALLAVPLTTQGFSGKYPTKSGRLELPDDENPGELNDTFCSVSLTDLFFFLLQSR